MLKVNYTLTFHIECSPKDFGRGVPSSSSSVALPGVPSFSFPAFLYPNWGSKDSGCRMLHRFLSKIKMYKICMLNLFTDAHHSDALMGFICQQQRVLVLNYNNTLLHKLMLLLFFVQLIPSPSLLPRANWPIRPSLYHSFPSAADLLYLIFAASPLWCCEKYPPGRTVSNLGVLPPHTATGTSAICFQYPVGFFAVRLLS